MLDIISFENRSHFHNDLIAMHALRHRVFVEKMGWDALRRPDGLERDQFDTPQALYLITRQDGRVVGGHRLLATTRPHLFSEIFPHLCGIRGVQRGERIFEINRTCVDQDYLGAAGAAWVQKQIMVGLIEFCVRANIERLTVLGPLKILSHYLQIGWSIKPLGEPIEIDGKPQAAFSVWTDCQCLSSIQRAYGITDTLVRYQHGKLDPNELRDAIATPRHIPELTV